MPTGTPTMWDNTPPVPGAGRTHHTTSTSLLGHVGRINDEVAKYQQQLQQGDLGYDPDGPPALKSSPSRSDFSEDSDDGGPSSAEGAKARSLRGSDAGSSGELHGGEDGDGDGAPAGVTSRWQVDEVGAEDADARVGRRADGAARGALSGSSDDESGEEGRTQAGANQDGLEAAAAGQGEAGAEAAAGVDGAATPAGADAELPGGKSMLDECRSVEEFERLNHINEGTYGVVFRARDKRTGAIRALKKVKMDKQRDGFPLTSVREINILLSLRHENIVNVSEVVVGSSLDSIFMVMEYVEHDLKELMRSQAVRAFSVPQVKCLMQQLLAGVAYLHHNWVLHRDLKSSNILYSNTGALKICDFGLARQYGSPLEAFTQLVVTLWYRAPELLLSDEVVGPRGGTMKARPEYSTPVDVWSVGCIMAELLSGETLLPGDGEMDQIKKIFTTLGSPNDENWPGYKDMPLVKKLKPVFKANMPSKLRDLFPKASFDGRNTLTDCGLDLLSSLLAYDPKKRITAAAALNHPWFQENPRPTPRELMPTFPVITSKKEAAAKKAAAAKK